MNHVGLTRTLLSSAGILALLLSFQPQPVLASGSFTWHERTGSPVAAWVDVATSGDGTDIIAIAGSDYLYRSTDGGSTWSKPDQSGMNSATQNWKSVDMSSDGQVIVAAVNGGNLYVSTDGGSTWSTADLGATDTANFSSISVTDNGTKIAAATDSTIYISTDSGATWSHSSGSDGHNWASVAYARGGTRLLAVENQNQFYYSTDDGSSWTLTTNVSAVPWTDIAASTDGSHGFAVSDGVVTFLTSDGGANWAFGSHNFHPIHGLGMSGDAQTVVMASYGQQLQVTYDGGSNWTEESDTANWTSADVSADGAYAVAVADGGHVYTTWGTSTSAPTFAVGSGAATSIDANTEQISYAVSSPGSASLTSLVIDYATAADYVAHGSTYTASTSYTGALADTGAGNLTSLSCGTTYHYRLTLTNGDGQPTSSGDATFETASCTSLISFDGGDGTSGTPYLISTCGQLQKMQDDLTADYELASDVDCSATNPADPGYDPDGLWKDGTGFVPIGAVLGFSGTLEGNNHVITGLFEGRSTYAGLLGGLSGVVQNLTLEDVSISGLNDTGALAATTSANSLIASTSVTGIVHGNDRTGGLVGTANGTIQFSVASTTLSGNGEVGALVGEQNGTTTASHASGTVSGVNYVGGFIGLSNGTTTSSYTTAVVNADHGGTYSGGFAGGVTGWVSLSYARGSVVGGTGVGGFVGRVERSATIENTFTRSDVSGYVSKIGGFVGSNNGTISKSYATGDVSGRGSSGSPFSVGGFAGDNDFLASDSFSAGTVTTTPSYIQVGGFAGYQDGTAGDSAWWSGSYSSAVGSGPNPTITTTVAHRDDMKLPSQAVYVAGWDFVTFPVWDLATGTYPLTNAGWPYLHVLSGTFTAEENDTTVNDVDGSSGGGGYSDSFTDGDGTADAPYVISSCDQLPLVNEYLESYFILANDIDCTDLGLNAMIGGYGTNPFMGTFNGDNHTITIELYDPSQPGLGLFRSIITGFVENLTVEGYIFGEDVNGSIAGFAVDAGFENVHASSTVVSLVSETPTYPLTGTGGLVGGLYGGLIDNSTFTGVVASQFIVGGIAGFVLNDLGEGAGAIISRSSSQAELYGAFDTGGVAGYLAQGAQIRNSYSSSTLTYYPDLGTGYGSGAFGGLAGFVDTGIISRSYAAGSLTLGSDAAAYPSGGLVGAVQNASTTIVHSFSAMHVTTEGFPVGGFLGALADGDGTEQLYDDYFDTGRSGIASCDMNAGDTYDQCTGADGSATNYWLDIHHTPLWAWDTENTWDISGGESEFPLLRHSAGEPLDESDAFIGEAPPDDSGDSGDDTVPVVHHSSRVSRSSILSHLDSFLKKGKIKNLTTYVQQHTNLLKRYYSQGAALPAEVLTQLGIAPPSTPVVVPMDQPVRNLESGMTGEDVRALQNILITRATGAASAALKNASATGYFGSLTRAALAEYQKASAIAPAVGYFGPLTRTQMKVAGIAGVWW